MVIDITRAKWYNPYILNNERQKMDSFIFALNSVAPIIIMVAIGYVLKKTGILPVNIAGAANKLVFRVFLPCMLFLNVYNIESFDGVHLGYVIYALIALVGIFLVSIPLVMIVTKNYRLRRSLLQSTFRSNNALIGIPLAESLFGELGVIAASLLSAAIIPMFNILAVISLSLFRQGSEKPSVKKIFVGIVKNPLVDAIFLGIFMLVIRSFFVKMNISFRLSDISVLFSVMKTLSGAATPLALVALGAQFEFSAVSSLKKEIIFGTAMRIMIAPVCVIGIAYIFFRDSFDGAHFATLVAAFATPVAVSSVPMAQEMDSDVTLAGQLVVWTTLLSSVTIFMFAFALKALGIF